MVVAPEAIYFVFDLIRSDLSEESVDRRLAKAEFPVEPRNGEPYIQMFDDLPQDVGNAEGIPGSEFLQHTIVVPREIVVRVKYPWWGAMTVATEARQFVASPYIWSRKANYQFLQNFGWLEAK